MIMSMKQLPVALRLSDITQLIIGFLAEDDTPILDNSLQTTLGEKHYYTRRRNILMFSRTCRAFQAAAKPMLYKYYIVRVTERDESKSELSEFVEATRWISTLCIQLDVRSVIRNIAQVTKHLSKVLNYPMNRLRTIVLDVGRCRIRHNAVCDIETEDFANIRMQFDMPELQTIYVRNNGPMYELVNYKLGLALTDWILSCAGKDNNDAKSSNTKHNVTYPKFFPSYVQLTESCLTTLEFGDLELLEYAPFLLKKFSSTLQTLIFYMCRPETFNEIIFHNGKPVFYPALKRLTGVLTSGEILGDQFLPKEGVFPNLEYLFEDIRHTWQQAAGVRPHILANFLMKMPMPQLKVMHLAASGQMSLSVDHVPNLRIAKYYTIPSFFERAADSEVTGQFSRLLGLKSLDVLYYHDQIPNADIFGKLNIQCTFLTDLDVGLITFTFVNLKHILGILKHLRRFVFSISESFGHDEVFVVDDKPLNCSLQSVSVYRFAFSRQKAGLSPSETLLCRIPSLYTVETNEEGSMREFFKRMQTEKWFPWSEEVGKRIVVYKKCTR